MVGPKVGGIRNVTQEVAAGFRSRGFTVTELLVGDEGASAVRSLCLVIANRKAIRRAYRVHVEVGATSWAAFWFAVFASLLRSDVVLVAHDAPLVTKSPGAALIPTAPGWRDAVAHKVFARLLDRPLRALLNRRAGVGVVFSEKARSEWSDGPEHRVALDLGSSPPTPNAPAPSAAGNVQFVGFMGLGKGLDVLCDSWALIGAKYPATTLSVAGPVSRQNEQWLDDLKTQASMQANPPVWRGEVTDEEFDSLVANAAVVALPYRQSNPASAVVVRAMVEGRAIVASRTPAMVNVIEDGVSGLLVEPGDAQGLADAIKRLLDDPALRDRLGAAAAEVAARRFTWDAQLDGLLRAYELADVASEVTATTSPVVLVAPVDKLGGVSRHVCDLGLGLRERGVEVVVEVPASSVDVADYFRGKGFAVEDLGATRDGVWHLHLANTYDKQSALLVLKQRLKGRRIVITEHLPRLDASDRNLFPERARHPAAHLLKTLFKVFEYACVKQIVCLSRGSREFLSQRYPFIARKLVEIPNGVLVADSVSGEQPPLKDGRFVSLSSAALIQQKGIDVLVDAARHVTSNWQFLVCGQGHDHKELTAKIERESLPVELLGWRDDIDELLSAAHIACVPSRWESSPYVVLEAMAVGKPVIGTQIDGIGEMVVDGVTGYLVPPDDPVGLAHELDRFAALSLQERTEMGRAGVKRALAEYSFAQMVDQTMAIYGRFSYKK